MPKLRIRVQYQNVPPLPQKSTKETHGQHRQTTQKIADLPQKQKIKAITTSILYTLTILTLLTIIHQETPTDPTLGSHPAASLLIMFTIFTLYLTYTIKRIKNNNLPEIRAIEAILISATWLIYSYSTLYLNMSIQQPNTFNETLTHLTAIYLTVSVFTTVGFGDIHPQTEIARAIVTTQMLIGVTAIGIGIKLLFTIGKNEANKNNKPKSTNETQTP